jgi:hypothetical protein
MSFIPPMLATGLEDPRRLAEPRYIAEPKNSTASVRSSMCATIAPSTPSAALAAS